MTKVVEFVAEDLPENHSRRVIRTMSQETFIQRYGSGTLGKSARLGFNVYEAYLSERTRFEFGCGFIIVPRSRVTYSDIKLVPSHALTELGWHAERMIELRPFWSDTFVCKQFEVEFGDGTIHEGAGILVAQTSAPWVPNGYMILSIVAPNVGGKYMAAINPF